MVTNSGNSSGHDTSILSTDEKSGDIGIWELESIYSRVSKSLRIKYFSIFFFQLSSIIGDIIVRRSQ